MRRVLLPVLLILAAPSSRTLDAVPPAADATISSAVQARALIDRYCVTCHNQRTMTGGLSLDAVDLADVSQHVDALEKAVRKVRAGLMPPRGRPRPDKAVSTSLVTWLEGELDRAAAARPDPGPSEAFHRLNRVEYHNATKDLLHVDLDVSAVLPGDDQSYGFDNIAGVLRFSPTLLEGYLVAARRISRAAVGIAPPAPSFDVFQVPRDLPQDAQLEGLPFGTRGGLNIQYNVPVDGEYELQVRPAPGGPYDQEQELELTVDGERLAVFTLPAAEPRAGFEPAGGGGSFPPHRLREELGGLDFPVDPERQLRREARLQLAWQQADDFEGAEAVDAAAAEEHRNGSLEESRGRRKPAEWKVRTTLRAGPHDIAAAFLNRTPALMESLIEPYQNPFPSSGGQWSNRKGAYVDKIEVSGPFTVVGAGETPSRQRIFVCQPARESEEEPCAKAIVAQLLRRAYRRAVGDEDIRRVLVAYTQARSEGENFDRGIQRVIERILVSPEFLFRTFTLPAEGGADATMYRISDVELASRLSFFLWSSIPDDGLLDLAIAGKLKDPAVLDQEVRRLLKDPRAEALVNNFAGQWLSLRNVPHLQAQPYKDSDVEESLRRAMERETELFFDSIVREDRSVVDLLRANYTFVNERLATHYGIPNIKGNRFQRVTLPDGSPRGGLLGQASILAVTSFAGRTAPVVRGKWILENILGTPPPAPPANVPPLKEKSGGGQAATMRERMEEHRQNPVCASCHQLMDPLGLALENFDQVGRWRPLDEGTDGRRSTYTKIDARGTLPDGTTFDGPLELRQALLARSDQFVSTMVEKLLTYALGRGLEASDMPTVRAICRGARRDGYRFSSLVRGVVTSMQFQMRRFES